MNLIFKILFLPFIFFSIEANGLSLDFKKNFGSKGILENEVNGPYGSYYDKHDNYSESIILASQLTNGEQHARQQARIGCGNTTDGANFVSISLSWDSNWGI